MLLVIWAFLLSFLTFTINAQSLPGNWPPVDKPPPPVAEWTNLVDFSKVPNAPVAKSAGANCPAADTYCNWSCTNCVRTETTDIVDCPSKSDWGLSFDDGPTEFTPPLLDYLDSQQLKVTFFVIGSRVYENPTTLKREVDSGHQIGVHTWSHTPLTTQTNEEIIAEIKWTEYAIQQAVGITPKYMRPPYGDVDDRVRAILAQLGYKVVIWDKDTNDWMSGETRSFQISWVEGNFTEWVKENDPTGHISLEHDLYNQTAAQGPLVVPIVKGAGFNILPIYQCVGDTSYYVENTATATTATVDAAATSPAPASSPAPPTQNYLQNDTSPSVSVVSSSDSVVSSSDSDVSSPSLTPSNAISNINNNNHYSLLLVLFMLGYFII